MGHLGQNIAKLRGMRRLTQKEMAAKLALGQPEYSKIERKAIIDDDLLELISKALEVPVDAIKNFSDDTLVFHIENMHDNASANYQYYYNPIDKVIELYERLLRDKDELLKQKDESIETYKKQLKAS